MPEQQAPSEQEAQRADEPLTEAIAAAIWAQYPDAQPSPAGLVMANPHNIADVAARIAIRTLGRDRCIHHEAIHTAHHTTRVPGCPWCMDR